MVRLNITMPDDLGKELRHVRNKSGFIAEALREKLNRDKKRKLESLLIEGYRKSAQDDKVINQEWDAASQIE